MDGWLIWLIVAVILAIGELHTTGFFLGPFAVGAIIATLLAAAGAGGVIEWAVFLVVSLILLAMLRPLARAHRRLPAPLRTGPAALVGQSATVVERIANHEGVGCVKIGGEVWTARSLDDDREIEVGERVQVREIRGATALVSE
jgi:membrane protein implicated in regulation of membrane protease activity